MASAVESQRLISLSLGKIARSRGQRGGINLHKNLLVASVLNKARTHFMVESYNYQFAQQQMQRSQVVLSTPVPNNAPESSTLTQEQTPSGVRDESSPSTQGSSTCEQTTLAETRSTVAPLPEHTETCEPVLNNNTPQEIVVVQHTIAPTVSSCETVDKENISPSSCPTLSSLSSCSEESSSCDSNSDSDYSTAVLSQRCVTGEQHIEASNQLSQNAQLAANNNNNTLTFTTLSPCKQTSGTTTCSGILKRRRENVDTDSDSNSTLSDSDYPSSKRLCTLTSLSPSSDCAYYNTQSCELSSSHALRDGDVSEVEYDYESESDYEQSHLESAEPMQTSESPQISNLVTIFNSGFSGLCVTQSQSPLDYNSSSPNSPHPYSNSQSMSQSQSECQSSTSTVSPSPIIGMNHHWANTGRSNLSSSSSNPSSDNSPQQSSSCSSLVDRIGTISSAIVLSA